MIDLILDCVPQFPRDYKFTIGAEMQKLSVSIMQEVAAAYLNRNPMEKAQHLITHPAGLVHREFRIPLSRTICGR